MTTAEDVFWIYERNKNIYSDCVKLGKIDKCPEKMDGKCYCCYNEIVNPNTIGYDDTYCDMQRKTYIKPGQECPICLLSIDKKSESYLTDCGHGFHKLCMFKLFESKKKHKSFRCPMCRCNLGIPCIHPQKYNVFSSEINYLDKLEDFWNYFEFQICYYCDNGHVEGMNKDCILCTNYRKFGACSKMRH